MSERSTLRTKPRPFGRFLIAGVINTLLTYGMFLMLSSFLSYGIAYTITYLSGIALAYGLAATFVFGTGFDLRAALRFPVVYVVQYIYGLVVLSILIDGLRASRHVAILVVIVTSVPLTFFLSKYAIRPTSTPQIFKAWHDQDGP